MPREIIEKVASEAVAAVKTSDVAKQYAPLGIEQVTAGPAGFGREFSAEIDRVSKVVQTAGIKID